MKQHSYNESNIVLLVILKLSLFDPEGCCSVRHATYRIEEHCVLFKLNVQQWTLSK